MLRSRPQRNDNSVEEPASREMIIMLRSRPQRNDNYVEEPTSACFRMATVRLVFYQKVLVYTSIEYFEVFKYAYSSIF